MLSQLDVPIKRVESRANQTKMYNDTKTRFDRIGKKESVGEAIVGGGIVVVCFLLLTVIA